MTEGQRYRSKENLEVISLASPAKHWIYVLNGNGTERFWLLNNEKNSDNTGKELLR